MAIAIDLAIRGRGHVEPNPMVGCVLVRDEKIIGQGFHARFGGPHAEPTAIADAGEADSRDGVRDPGTMLFHRPRKEDAALRSDVDQRPASDASSSVRSTRIRMWQAKAFVSCGRRGLTSASAVLATPATP